MKKFLLIVLFAMASRAAYAATIVVPPANASQAGDSQLQPVFGFAAGEEFVFGHKNFSGPVEITAIAFRPDERTLGGSMDVVIPNFTIRMTTYGGTPDRLSGRYSDNATGDDTQVFSGSVHWVGSGLFGTSPNPFLMQIPLSTPFFFNPAQGDLLVECSSSGPTLQSNAANADAAIHGDFSIGYTYSGGVSSGYGSTAISPVIQFTITPVPEPGVVAFLTAGVLLLRRQWWPRRFNAKPGWVSPQSGQRIIGSVIYAATLVP